MKLSEYVPAFEAVLFACGEPVEIDRFCRVFELEAVDTIRVMELLSEKLNRENSGIRLVRLENLYQLCTREKYADEIRKFFDLRRKTPLSQAALEVLAVVAYNQPVTRSFIEQVRGVDCSGTVATLVEKGLLEERGRLELPGRPLLYGTTPVFLRCFGISDLSELPKPPHDTSQQPGELAQQLSLEEMEERPKSSDLKDK